MVMGSKTDIKEIKPEGEIYACPSCGYQDGFHVSFLVNQQSSEGEPYLICPNCHSRFRMGWTIVTRPGKKRRSSSEAVRGGHAD